MRVYRFENPIEESLDPRPKRTRRRFPFRWVLIALVVLAVPVGVILFLGRDTGSSIPAGTSIDGVAVGDMTIQQARTVIRAHGQEVVARGLVFVAGRNHFQIDPAAISLRPNAAAAVALAQADVGFIDRVKGRLGFVTHREIPLKYVFNTAAYAKATLPVRQAVSIAPHSASVSTTEAGTYLVTPAVNGQLPQVGEMRAAVHDLGTSGPQIPVGVRVVAPLIPTAIASAAVANARTFVKTRHIVALKEDSHVVPSDVTRRAAGFKTTVKSIRFSIGRGVLRGYFSRIYGKNERPARDAVFVTNSAGKARIIAGHNGRGVDVDALAQLWEKTPDLRIAPITVGVREPGLTTEKAQNLGVKQIVGQFFTPYNGGARVTNIKRAAEILDQFILPAHATFSLNDALGERTLQRGFVEAPMIGEKNVLKDSVGGGVSQVATTTFNAAFFSGLKLIAHTPHSFWISRYPMGREATVSWGDPQLIFTNNWDAPIVILTHTNDAGITVQFLSDPLGRKVVAVEGKPYSYTKAKIIRERDPTLAPGEAKVKQGKGSDGFHIKYGRRVYKDGKLISQEMWHWRYAPEDGIILVGPKLPAHGGGGGATTDGGAGASTTGGATTDGAGTSTVPASGT